MSNYIQSTLNTNIGGKDEQCNEGSSTIMFDNSYSKAVRALGN